MDSSPNMVVKWNRPSTNVLFNSLQLRQSAVMPSPDDVERLVAVKAVVAAVLPQVVAVNIPSVVAIRRLGRSASDGQSAIGRREVAVQT